MILNDKPNCQVSRILMNPRPIYVKRSGNDCFLTANLTLVAKIRIHFKKKKHLIILRII
jgi:hypothetical protein